MTRAARTSTAAGRGVQTAVGVSLRCGKLFSITAWSCQENREDIYPDALWCSAVVLGVVWKKSFGIGHSASGPIERFNGGTGTSLGWSPKACYGAQPAQKRHF